MLVVMPVGALHDNNWECISVLFVCRQNWNNIVVAIDALCSTATF